MRTTTVAAKPAGGYVLVLAGQLTQAWEWYRCGLLELVDLRVYLACREIAARRQGAVTHHLDTFEVSRLTGAKRPGPSVTRLTSAGLLRFDEGGISFPATPGRLVPFPRRMLRHLARDGRASMIATVFGHLLRCLFYRKGKCHSGGRCKASHVSKVFGIDIRRVKAARAELVALGWLIPEPEKQWALNLWGGVFTVNLRWSILPPLRGPGGAALPPPESDENPPPGIKDQKPPDPGVSIRDVQPADLEDTARTLELHDQAVKAGLVTSSEADRLKVVAAAEHALAVATTNAPGLFASILRGGWWKFITQGDEDAARLRIKEQLHPAPAPRGFVAAPVQGPKLSEDERVVREVRAAAARAGYKGDPFYLIRQRDPSWTRPRWEAAQRKGPDALPPRETSSPSLADTLF